MLGWNPELPACQGTAPPSQSFPSPRLLVPTPNVMGVHPCSCGFASLSLESPIWELSRAVTVTTRIISPSCPLSHPGGGITSRRCILGRRGCFHRHLHMTHSGRFPLYFPIQSRLATPSRGDPASHHCFFFQNSF